MSSIAQPLAATLPVGEALAPVAVVLLGGGLVGMSIRNMFESIMSEDEPREGDADGSSPSTDGGSGLMAEGGQADDDEDLGGLGGLDDDDDLGGFDDGFGEMDEGGDVDELEHRIDEMEAEVGNLSSTVNTVRNENEQISESVAEVEENVRKLLDIYEMVTRGVNPFADDIDAGMGGGMGDDGGFGLFADDGEDESDDVDEDIAAADAEGFFDEDLVDDGDLEADADAEADDFFGDGEDELDADFDDSDGDFEDEEFEEELDEDFEGELDEDEDGEGGGGTSFQDLKEEYESGEADWADGEAALDGDEETDDEDLPADAAEDAIDGAGVDEELDDLADDDLFDEVIEDEDESEASADTEDDGGPDVTVDAEDEAAPETRAAPEAQDQPEVEASGGESHTDQDVAGDVAAVADEADSDGADDASGKPYLATLPSGFGSELLVVEWLESLVEEVGVRETARAIDYYESIDWIAAPVADDLQDYLAGFEDGATGSLSIDDHTRSLRYIGQLDGGGAEVLALEQARHGGGSDGIQR